MCRPGRFVGLCLILLACGSVPPTSDRDSFVAGVVTRKSDTIILGITRLFPGQFQLRHVSVAVDSTRFNYLLSGAFEVSDGFSLEGFLMRREDVPLIVDGQEVDRLWRSGGTNTTGFEFGMPTDGEYTFVLDNRVGETEWKSVDARLVLFWDEFESVAKP